MITYTTVNSNADLESILTLQKRNLHRNVDPAEIKSQGFVTVEHTYDTLKKLNDHEKHVIAKEGDKLIGYVLAMTKHSRSDIPVLFSLFNVFDTVMYKNNTIAAYHYIVVGQVCVDKEYRGQGIFDNCYAAYREFYQDKYDFAITEIATTNSRSLHAHKRVGFEQIYSYTGPGNTGWVVVLWDWKTRSKQRV